MSRQLGVLAVMRDGASDYDESGHGGLADDMRKAAEIVAELIVEAQRVADGTTGDLHYLRAALARVGGAA